MNHPDPLLQPTGPGSSGSPEPRQRLHPLSPLLHGAKALAVIIAAISVQGAARLGVAGFVGTLLVVMCLAVAVSAVSWLVTGYHMVGRELRIYDGVLVRRSRAIPLERLQAVDVVRPLLARLFGLAELRLEVVGGGKTEAPLAFLTASDAVALRERLLAVAGRAGAPVTAQAPDAAATPDTAAAPDTATGAAVPPDRAGTTGTTGPGHTAPAAGATRAPQRRHLHSVVNREVLVSQLLTPPVMVLPLAIAAVVGQYWIGSEGLSLVVLASMLVAIIGVVQQPVRRIMSHWNFRLGLQEPTVPGQTELRMQHGLSETRSHTVPLRRIQALRVTWPFLWRRRQWLHVRVDVAGYSATDQEIGTSDQLLPVGDSATATRLTPVAVPGVDLPGLELSGVPARARWVAPLRQPMLGAACADRIFATRDGRVTRELTLVPYERMQSVRVLQGPLQRLLGLATVRADTAGALNAIAHHWWLDQARALAAELTRRSRAAREAHAWAADPRQRAQRLAPGATGESRRLPGGGTPGVGDAASGGPPALGEAHDQAGDADVRPADEHIDHPVLPGVDQGEGHRQGVGEQQWPPATTHRTEEEQHHEQRERGVQ